MKVLIIDDIEDSVKGIEDFCDDRDWNRKLVNFDSAFMTVFDFDPDVIILDWKDDETGIDEGESILERIWKITFRPIVLFSARVDTIDLDDKFKESKMLKLIRKGDEEPVIQFLRNFEKFSASLAEYRKEMGKALIIALDSIDFLMPMDVNPASVSYVLSKRTSSYFDERYIPTLSPSWVQYLCPPISKCLNVCDIIRVISEGCNPNTVGLPEEYRIILTPSCDLYHDEIRSAKVTHALCAQCFPKNIYHGNPLMDTPSSGKIKSVRSMLTSGYNDSFVALPGFTNLLPFMTVDLRKVELIPITDIGLHPPSDENKNEFKFFRVASVLSPFREQIVWAYLNSSCRPGVPDRNFAEWAKEILSK